MSSTLPPPPDELLCDPLYSRLKEYLIKSTGLAYYADKDAELARRIHRRLSSFGVQDCSSYLDVLRDPRHGPSELDALIAEVTIGETYFFRHREHFDALRDIVLPELITRNRESRRLRIWCAGCADGAEPYSLSILLRRELAHLLSGWAITILGTDINPRCLAFAREGKFEEWSLRSTSEDLRRACFLKEGKHWKIASEYKEGVSFQVHNLVEHAFASPLDGFAAFDLIVCRNVMIYFGPEPMQRIVHQFHKCLVPGAWLLVGPSEPNLTCFRSFCAVNAPGVTLYQKSGRPAPGLEEAVPIPTLALPPIPPLPLIPPSERADLPTLNQTPSDGLVPTLADLRKRADQGDWKNAVRCCEHLLELDNLNPLVHFHYGLVLEQVGNHAESERSFRRAIYLDRQSVLAHYHLGLLLRSRGNGRLAARFFANTLELLNTAS